MEDVSIQEGFADGERADVAALYWEAFGRKLRPAFVDEATGRSVMESLMRRDRMLVARRAGRVVGVCGFRLDGTGVADLGWARLRESLSVPAALRACLVLSVLSRSDRPGAMTLDGICVDRTVRGQGVGSALLDAAADRARSIGARSVRLSVIDANPRARALYERHGYRAAGRGSLGPLAPVYGFDGYTTMTHRVA